MTDQSGDRKAGADPRPKSTPSRGKRLPWMPRPPVWGRLKRARNERDEARADLKAARSALNASKAEGAAARLEAEAAREEVQSIKATLAAARSEADTLRGDLRDEFTDYSAKIEQQLSAISQRQDATARVLRYMPRELLTDIQAMDQLRDRYRPIASLPPVAGWALGPAGLLAVVDQIERRRAQLVVECGSGTSTLWIGYALKSLGRGRVIALDHLDVYAERTRSIVADHGLSSYVEVRLAPLETRATPRGDFLWYDFDADALEQRVDVLLVDGPPGTTGPHARYPALPVFASHLSDDAAIIVDDLDRRDEREMVDFWLEDDRRLSRMGSPGHGVEMLGFQSTAANTER